MQAIHLHTQDAVLLLHSWTGGCCEIQREKRPFTTSHPLYTLLNMIAMTIGTLMGKMLIIPDNTDSAASQRNTTTIVKTSETNIRPSKRKKQTQEQENALSWPAVLASHSCTKLHLSHRTQEKLQQILNCLLRDRLLITVEDFTIAAAGRRFPGCLQCSL